MKCPDADKKMTKEIGNGGAVEAAVGEHPHPHERHLCRSLNSRVPIKIYLVSIMEPHLKRIGPLSSCNCSENTEQSTTSPASRKHFGHHLPLTEKKKKKKKKKNQFCQRQSHQRMLAKLL